MTNVLHLYAQNCWHDNAYFVGNRAALEALREAIETALNAGGPARAEAMTADGYGRTAVRPNAFVVLNDADWQAATWQRAALPYTDEVAHEKRDDAVWPWSLLADRPALSAAEGPAFVPPPAEIAEHHGNTPGPVVTTPLCWDCECDNNGDGYGRTAVRANTHPKSEAGCPVCGAARCEQPDSRADEVLALRPELLTDEQWRAMRDAVRRRAA